MESPAGRRMQFEPYSRYIGPPAVARTCGLTRVDPCHPRTKLLTLAFLLHYYSPFAPEPFGCSYAFCRYLRASSSAPWVLSLVWIACRYSLVARSR